jgi:hypothetical protein
MNQTLAFPGGEVMSIEEQFKHGLVATVLDMIVIIRDLFAAAGIGSQSYKTSTDEL